MPSPDEILVDAGVGSGIDFTLPGTMESIVVASHRLRDFLEPRGINPEAGYALETILEEMMTNTVKYGFQGSHDDAFRIRLTTGPDQLSLTIEDTGRMFDPTAAPQPRLDLSLEEMPVGGLGIHLVRQFAKKIEYQRNNGWNCFSAHISVDQGAPSPCN